MHANANISDLTGLEFAASLTELHLGGEEVGSTWVNSNSITDISALGGLTYLEILYLEDNSITDVSVLAGLINLRVLYLENNPIQSTFSLCQLQEQNPELELDIEIACKSYYLLWWLWDVDQDGVIDLFDLTSLVSTLSERTSDTGDFNNDGRVDFQDLMLIAEDTDESTAASGPSALAQLPMEVQSATVRNWIDMAHTADDGSLAFQEGIANLKRFLGLMHQGKTELLSNYPNPFNPETWIPYRLANATDVQISIPH